ncbi:MAG: thiolase family protein [Candidatus Diapherotrites archaeon]|uniref:Thiolase family protein n=1 Tax=Candidatus Iainarchaeum sp. TaxID=3101447 RepID=A0A938YX94_9ARCH|nr:thiolase family protein [Candidatus Diapherotrites archaeon]
MGTVIVNGFRTPLGKFLGKLAPVHAFDLGAAVIKQSVGESGLEKEAIDEVIMGNVLKAGLGQNPARKAALKAGLPEEIPSYTIDMVCGSGLKAVMLAAQQVELHTADFVVAGGFESMSNAPYLIEGFRKGKPLGDAKVIDSMLKDGLICPKNEQHVGLLSERLTERYKISREEQDMFALRSNRLAIESIEKGYFKDEIVPIEVDNEIIETDERPRKDSTLEKMLKLKPSFKENGCITAANASGLNDGAAALLITSSEKAGEKGLKPMAEITGFAQSAGSPSFFGLQPVQAVKKLLKKTGQTMADFDLVELNEAFAIQTLAVSKELEIPDEKLNVSGGAIALGHPIGTSGARILVTMVHNLHRLEKENGLVTICIGGGQALAMSVKKL